MATPSREHESDAAPVSRRLVLVVGSATVGSPWVADFHEDLLGRCGVQAEDARPAAWFEAGKATTLLTPRRRLHEWVELQLAGTGPELVVTDPRLPWFLGSWRWVATRCAAAVEHEIRLRPIAADGDASGAVHRTAAWVNVVLHTERSSRGFSRRFVRDPLQHGPRQHGPFQHGPHELGRGSVELRDIAEESWRQLDRLVDPDCDTPAVHAALDQLRSAYGGLYDDAEAITRSVVVAAQRRAGREGGEG